jgi:uncharacterized membrane protein YedE/YeeE
MLWLVETIGEQYAAGLVGLVVGLVFGIAAQRSRFCLRASAVEFARAQLGPRMAVWLLTFSTALAWTQGAVVLGIINPDETRIMSVAGSYSGAILGGLMFGVGMILARGCSGRLLVLAATGNLRSVMNGLIFAVVAQMALSGWLAPVRNWLAALWTTPAGRNVDLGEALSLPHGTGLAGGLAAAAFAIWLAQRNRIGAGRLVMASGVGFSVALGWIGTSMLAAVSFEPVAVQSATFTGPSANTLMFFLTDNPVLRFDVGLVAGVFAGAFLASIIAGDFRFQGFDGPAPMRRGMIGAALMGFGGMLAGGCAIGNGLTGASILAETAWIALVFMWVGAVVADVVIDQRGVVSAVA